MINCIVSGEYKMLSPNATKNIIKIPLSIDRGRIILKRYEKIYSYLSAKQTRFNPNNGAAPEAVVPKKSTSFSRFK